MEILLGVKDMKPKIVSIERFGLLLKWFGPLTFRNNNIVDKIYDIVKQEWFHGVVSRERLSIITTEEMNKLQKKEKKFFVRITESEPIQNHPFSITVISKNDSSSYRVNYDSDSGLYSVSAMKKEELVTASNPDLTGLINSFYVNRKGPIKLKINEFVRSDLHKQIFIKYYPKNYMIV